MNLFHHITGTPVLSLYFTLCSQQIYDRYAGDKNIIIVDGDHNTMRPQFLFDSAGIFLASTLQVHHSVTTHYVSSDS